MNVAIIGLGRMGMGMGARLAKAGHTVAGFDLNPAKRAEAATHGIAFTDSLAVIPNALPEPRVVIIMVPAGPAVDSAIDGISHGLSHSDVIIDGGNSFYKDSIARGARLKSIDIAFLDMGVSGGVWGENEGYCLMVGGPRDAYDRVEPALLDLAQQDGCAYVGPSGAGHFSKMVHNGIEYGMLQAYAEGFEILKASNYDYDFAALSKLWNHGSVVRSWLLELAQLAFEESGDLEHVRGWVEDSGEGRWTVMEAIEERVPAPVIALSLMMRFRSRQEDPFSGKVIAALRNKFGGHEVKSE